MPPLRPLSPIWTEAAIKERLKEAADALRRLPPGLRRARLTGWPDVVRAASEAYGYGAAQTRPAAPSPAAITRMDETLGWLFCVDAEARRVAWARASGISWRKLEDIDGRSHVTLRRIHDRAVAAILRRLNADAIEAGQRLFAPTGVAGARSRVDRVYKIT
jgi:hypothetical protein